jgi:hypothetical protein
MTDQEPSLESPRASSVKAKVETEHSARMALKQRIRDILDRRRELRLKPLPLTRENLARLTEIEKKKLSIQLKDEWSTTKTYTSTTSGFNLRARENRILDPISSKPPTNLEDIMRRHIASRATPSPTHSEYEGYAAKVLRAGNEATMVFEVGGHMLKEQDHDGYQRAFDRPLTGFPRDIGFNDGLPTPQPNFVEGPGLEGFHPFPVEEHLTSAILYNDDIHSIVLPHLAGEWMGADGDMANAAARSGHNGASLVHARNEALSYLGRFDPPGHAEIMTFTTDGTEINYFAHYALQADDGVLEYHQYQYASENVNDTYLGHLDGRTGLRNAQDHAKVQSCYLKEKLKAHWNQYNRDLQSMPLSDSDEDDYVMIKQSSSAASSKLHMPSPSKSLPPANDSCDSHNITKRQRVSHRPLTSRKKHRSKEPRSDPGTQVSAPESTSNNTSSVDEYWAWCENHKMCYHLNKDGTRTWDSKGK